MDTQAGRAHFYTYNRDANWHNMTFTPATAAPLHNTAVTVPGLPNGWYCVETWDTTLRKQTGVRILSSLGGHLVVSLGTLSADTAIKFSRWL